MSIAKWGHFAVPPDTLHVAFVRGGRMHGKRTRRREVALDQSITYQRPTGEIITVPRRFRSDGATIPAPVWWIIGHPFDWFLLAALIHDWLCYEPNRALHHRGTVHRVMYEVMRWQVDNEDGSRWRCEFIYAAIRLFGPRWDKRLPT